MARSDFYLVERPDHKYGAAHIALRQIRRQGRIRQPLLLYPENRQGAWLRTALGDLRGRERRLDDPARLVWLAASHGRYTANRRELHRPRVGIAVSAEFDRHAASLASAGLDLGRQCAASGDRRLRGLDAGRLRWSLVHGWTRPPRRGKHRKLNVTTLIPRAASPVARFQRICQQTALGIFGLTSTSSSKRCSAAPK